MQHQWSHKEICFEHSIVPLLRSHNLLRDPSFTEGAFGCQSSGCGITASLIPKYALKRQSQIALSSLNLSFNNKNASMDDLVVTVHDATTHRVIARRGIKMKKLMASAIKRSTQPTTKRNMVCSASFGPTALHFVVRAVAPRVVMAIGVRNDENGKHILVDIPNDDQIPKNMASFWYQNWCIQGLQENTATSPHRMDHFIAIQHNKFVGDIKANLDRIAVTFYVEDSRQSVIPNAIYIVVNGKKTDRYPQIIGTVHSAESQRNHRNQSPKCNVDSVPKKVRFDHDCIARKEPRQKQTERRPRSKVPDLDEKAIDQYLKRYNEEVQRLHIPLDIDRDPLCLSLSIISIFGTNQKGVGSKHAIRRGDKGSAA